MLVGDWGWTGVSGEADELSDMIAGIIDGTDARLILTNEDSEPVAALVTVEEAAMIQLIYDSPGLKAYFDELLEEKRKRIEAFITKDD